MNDLISREAAIDALKVAYWDKEIQSAKDDPCIVDAMTDWAIRMIKELPSAQPEVRPIDYQDCSNAILKMWMGNVVTDGEYNRIMDKLNAYWGKKDE